MNRTLLLTVSANWPDSIYLIYLILSYLILSYLSIMNVCTYVNTCESTYAFKKHTDTYLYVSTSINIYIYIYIYKQINVYAYSFIYIHTSLHAYMLAEQIIDIHIYININIYTQTHTYKHICTFLKHQLNNKRYICQPNVVAPAKTWQMQRLPSYRCMFVFLNRGS